MKLIKKIRTTRPGASEDAGLSFAPDGRSLYVAQGGEKDFLNRRIVVYDAQSFEPVSEWFAEDESLIPDEVEWGDDGQCYVLGREISAADGGTWASHFVGVLKGGAILDKRPFSDDWMSVRMYMRWKSAGFTDAARACTVRYTPDAPRERGGSLKRPHETGRLL